MRFSIFFSFFVMCALSAQAEISLVPPKGWECIQDPQQLPQKILRIYVGVGKGSFTPSINIANEETKVGIEEYLRLAKSYHESQSIAKCAFMGKIETKAGPAHLLQIDTATQWGNVRFIQAILIKDSLAYVITATCLQQEFSVFSAQFLKSVQSFSIQ